MDARKLAALLMVGALVGCGSTAKTDEPAGEQPAQEQEAEQAPEYRVKQCYDFRAEVESVDETGVTVTMWTKGNSMTVWPKRVEFSGVAFDMDDGSGNTNPQVHISVNGGEDVGIIEMHDGERYSVKFSADGVTDYSSFKMISDNTAYGIGDSPKAYPTVDVPFEVGLA